MNKLIGNKNQDNGQLPDINCPVFSDVLKSKEVEIDISGQAHHCIRIRPTAKCLLLRAACTALSVTVGAVFLMLVLYLPDYIFDYSSRDQDFLQFFVKYLLSCIAIVMIAGFASVILRPRSVYIDLTSKRFVFARFLNNWSYGRDYVDFCEVKSIERVPADGMSATNKISLLANGDFHCVAESRMNSDDLDRLETWLKAICNLSGGKSR